MFIYIVKKYTIIFTEITKLIVIFASWPIKARKKTYFVINCYLR